MVLDSGRPAPTTAAWTSLTRAAGLPVVLAAAVLLLALGGEPGWVAAAGGDLGRFALVCALRGVLST